MPRDTEWMGQDLPTPLDLAIFADLLTPTLVVHLDAVRRNIARMCAATGSIDRLRVHIKSAKLRVVFDEFLAAGITHFKCATTREAAQLLAASEARGIAVDLLVAFPHRGPNLRRIEALARLHPRSRLSVLVETEDDIEDIEGDASMATALGVFVDIDAGMHRTGIPSTDAARIESVAKAAASRLRGLHFYEGHVHSGSFADRCSQAFPLYDELVTLVAQLEASGLCIDEVVTSGTPSFMPALAHPGLAALTALTALTEQQHTVHRLSPGTLVYFDARSRECEELDYEFAAFVLTSVVSQPTSHVITVDAGSKAIAAEAGSPVAVAPDWPGLVARTPSEEHLPFDVVAGAAPARGKRMLLVPRHVCPTVNLAEAACVVEERHGTSTVRIEAVSARAHEVVSPDGA